MKTTEHLMHAARCGVCHGDGPTSHTPDGAALLARALGWAEEHGVTRCAICRRDLAEIKRAERVKR